MTMISDTDIGKAQYRLECQNLFDSSTKLDAESRQAVRETRFAEWKELFCSRVESDVWNMAVDIAVRSCKGWPSLSEMCAFVDDAMKRQEATIAAERKTIEEKETAATKIIKVDVKAILAAAKAGEFKKYKVDPITPEVLAFCKVKWPDADMKFVESNIWVILSIMKQEKICEKCMDCRYCRTNGYKNIGRIDKRSGILYGHMAPCPAKGRN